METILGLLALCIMAVGGLAAVFMCFFQPIWGIVDVAVSKEHSGAAKTAVILLTVLLLGPVMTFFYGLVGTKTSVYRRATIAGALVLLFSGVALLSLAALSSSARETVDTVIPDELRGPQV